MSISEDIQNKNISCTYRLPIPIGEILHKCREKAVQDVSDRSLPGGSGRHKDKPSKESALYFCSLENFESAIVYLSQELQALGLGNLSLTTAGSPSGRTHDALATAFTGGIHRGTLLELDLVCLVNRCWEVVQLYRASVRDGCTLQEQRKRDATANTKLQASVSGLQEVRQECERKVQEALEQRRQAVEEAQQLRQALRAQKDETHHLNALLAQRNTQHEHATRKLELSVAGLRARLGQLVAGGAVVERHLELSSALQPHLSPQQERSRAKWDSPSDASRHVVELYRRALGQYECWLSDVCAHHNSLTRFVQSIACFLLSLVRRHARVVAPEDMAASLTDSIYSTDSLDELAAPAATTTTATTAAATEATAPTVTVEGDDVAGMQEQIKDSLLALSVLLAEKGAGELKEARLRRVQELAASAQPPAPRNSSSRLSTGQLGRPAAPHATPNPPRDGGRQESGAGGGVDTSAGIPRPAAASDSALLQLVRHLGIVAATEGDVGIADRAASSVGSLFERGECRPPPAGAADEGDIAATQTELPAQAAVSNSPQLDASSARHLLQLSSARPAQTNAGQLQSGHTKQVGSNESSNDENKCTGEDNRATDGSSVADQTTGCAPDSPASAVTDQSWLRVSGGPDDSVATEVDTLKKLLEEERLQVRKEKERYTDAVIRLNRERAAFEQDKVQLLRQQFLDELPSDTDLPSPIHTSFCQVSAVPAWLSRHHERPFSPGPGSPGPATATTSPVGKASTREQQRESLPRQRDGKLSAGTRLTSAPNITPPPPHLEWEFRARRRPLVLTRSKEAKDRRSGGSSCDSGRPRHEGGGHTSGQRSAPATRAPSTSRSHGDGCSDRSCPARQRGAELGCGRSTFTLGTKKSRSPSVGVSSRVAASARLSPKSRDSSLHRRVSRGRDSSSATSGSGTRDSSRSGIVERHREPSVRSCGSMKKKEGSTTLVGDGASVRYHTLPRSHKLERQPPSNYDAMFDKASFHTFSETSKFNGAGSDRSTWHAARGRDLVSVPSAGTGKGGELVRQSLGTTGQRADTSPSHCTGRQQAVLFSSNSLPRMLKSHERSSLQPDAGPRDPRMLCGAGRRGGGDAGSVSGGGAEPLSDGPLSHRPKSDSFGQAVHLNDMFASLPPELLARRDSNEVFSEASSIASGAQDVSCSGACKEFLKVPSNAACLCHLLKQKPIADRELSEFSPTASTDASDFDAFDSVSQAELQLDFKTNQRIDAIESSLLKLISQITSSDKRYTDRVAPANNSSQVDATLRTREGDHGLLQASISSNDSEMMNVSMVSAPPSAGDSDALRNGRPQLSVSSGQILPRQKQSLARAEPVENLPAASERILKARNLLPSVRVSARPGLRLRHSSSSSHANSD